MHHLGQHAEVDVVVVRRGVQESVFWGGKRRGERGKGYSKRRGERERGESAVV